MKYVFDIDGTICSDTKGAYQNAVPINSRIEKVNQLYAQGNRIVFYTARGMGRSENKAEIASAQWYEFTINQLQQWGVNFHELHLGKPAGDMYIDDKAITDTKFFTPNLND
jgi:capsule biosynthesis phosphatase